MRVSAENKSSSNDPRKEGILKGKGADGGRRETRKSNPQVKEKNKHSPPDQRKRKGSGGGGIVQAQEKSGEGHFIS